MIFNTGLPKTFWGEAMTTTAFLKNRCPSSVIGLKTPQEMWQGKPAIYKELKVFGCLAYAHIKQDKLDFRAVKCIFVGYPAKVKGYKLWRLEGSGQKCYISRDVIFDEIKMRCLVKYLKSKKSGGSTESFEVEVEQDGRINPVGDHNQDRENNTPEIDD